MFCCCLSVAQNLLAKMLTQITEHYDGLNMTALLSHSGFTRNDINIAVIQQVCLFTASMSVSEHI